MARCALVRVSGVCVCVCVGGGGGVRRWRMGLWYPCQDECVCVCVGGEVGDGG